MHSEQSKIVADRSTLDGESYRSFVVRVAPLILCGLAQKDSWSCTATDMDIMEDQAIESAMRLFNKLTRI